MNPSQAFKLDRSPAPLETAGAPRARLLKGIIWTYFLLLIFEGAFRKWWTPSLSKYLLIVRDPVVLLAYLEAARIGVFRLNGMLLANLVLTILSLLLGLMAEHANIKVTLFGIRANFLHLPLIFIMGSVLNRRDVIWLGRAILLISLPMAWVMVQQFRGGENSPWNVGAGGELGGQLSSAMGKVRASGTFSFITGVSSFVPLTVPFILLGFFEKQAIPKWLVIPAALALPIACVTSGSRSVVAGCAVIFVGMVVAAALHGRVSRHLVRISFGIGVGFLVASRMEVFSEANEVLMKRFEMASNSEGGVIGFVGRFMEGFLKPFRMWTSAPLFGLGVGACTNAARAFLSGDSNYVWAEDEWSRIVLELGAPLGFLFIGLRCWIFGFLLRQTVQKARESGDPLPFMLLTAGGIGLLIGQWGVSSAAGFGVFIPGMILASFQTGNRAHSRPVGRLPKPEGWRVPRSPSPAVPAPGLQRPRVRPGAFTIRS